MVELFNSWRDAPAVPRTWTPADPPSACLKRPVKNRAVLRILRSLLPGHWRKVYHYGKDGTEVHYFQHASGKVAFVKHKIKPE
jgi:hypothetical protein